MAKRKPKSIKRGVPTREAYDRVLIVCEGRKTEPNYLNEIAASYKLSSANITIDGSSDSSPLSVVDHAIKEYESEKRKGGNYDKVFCVFDRDSASTFTQALDKIARYRPSGIFVPITSVPCFEYWVLLHFQYTTQPFNGTGSLSPCEQVIGLLRTHLSQYAKGTSGLRSQILQNETNAIDNAGRSRNEAIQNGCENPTTSVDKLVSYLSELKK